MSAGGTTRSNKLWRYARPPLHLRVLQSNIAVSIFVKLRWLARPFSWSCAIMHDTDDGSFAAAVLECMCLRKHRVAHCRMCQGCKGVNLDACSLAPSANPLKNPFQQSLLSKGMHLEFTMPCASKYVLATMWLISCACRQKLAMCNLLICNEHDFTTANGSCMHSEGSCP